jgi:hypothetical protein
VPRRSDQLHIALGPEQLRRAVLGVVHASGWSVKDERPNEMRLVEYRTASASSATWKAKVEVRWKPRGDGCDVHFDGISRGSGRSSRDTYAAGWARCERRSSMSATS